MKELRADTNDQVLRVAFAFDPSCMAILLIGGNNTGTSQTRFHKQLITKADELFDARLRALKKKEK